MRCPRCLQYINEAIQHCQCEFVERLVAEFVVEEGRLIISQYRNRRDDLTQGWVDWELVAWGFKVTEIYSGYSGEGLELCRVAVLQA